MKVRANGGFRAHRKCSGVKRVTPLEEGLMTNDDV
jgi:hypothetical protein